MKAAAAAALTLSFGCQGLPAMGLSGFLGAYYRMVNGEHFMSYQVVHKMCNHYYHYYCCYYYY